MASPEDHKHITTVLIPELLSNFSKWGREYRQPRDLGLLGEFAGLYRKARKLKTLLWDRHDGDPPPEAAGWREGPREIMMEVVAHGLLMLVDWDNAHPEEAPKMLGDKKSEGDGHGDRLTQSMLSDKDADAPNYEADAESTCGYMWQSPVLGTQYCIRSPHGTGSAHRSTEGEYHIHGGSYRHSIGNEDLFVESDKEEVDELVHQRERERYQLRQMGDADIADRIGGV